MMNFRFLVFLFALFIASPASATCTDAFYNSTRASRINAIVAAAPTGAMYWIMPSHGDKGVSVAHAQGSLTYDGHPVIVLGSAGARWSTFADCIPWAAIGAKSPYGAGMQASINDVDAGTCCGSNGNGTVAYMLQIMTAIGNAEAAGVPVKFIATDPPPESAAGLPVYQTHQSARAVYYVASNCGGTCTWTQFGWTGSNRPAGYPFIDQYSLMSGVSCLAAASEIPWNPPGPWTPCLASVGSTIDNLHFPFAGVESMVANILAGH